MQKLEYIGKSENLSEFSMIYIVDVRLYMWKYRKTIWTIELYIVGFAKVLRCRGGGALGWIRYTVLYIFQLNKWTGGVIKLIYVLFMVATVCYYAFLAYYFAIYSWRHRSTLVSFHIRQKFNFDWFDCTLASKIHTDTPPHSDVKWVM